MKVLLCVLSQTLNDWGTNSKVRNKVPMEKKMSISANNPMVVLQRIQLVKEITEVNFLFH